MAPVPGAQAGGPMPGMPGFPAGAGPGFPGFPGMPGKVRRFPQAAPANESSVAPNLATGVSSSAAASATPLQGQGSGGQGMISGVTATLGFPINRNLLVNMLTEDQNATNAGVTISTMQLVIAKRDITARNEKFQPITDKMTLADLEEGRLMMENLREVPGQYAVLMVMPSPDQESDQDRQNARTSGASGMNVSSWATVLFGLLAAIMVTM